MIINEKDITKHMTLSASHPNVYTESTMKTSTKKGFSLIELMIVIAIIGLLGTLSIFSFQQAHNNTKISESKSEIKELHIFLQEARSVTGFTLKQLANSGCSDCACRSGDMRNTTGDCFTNWRDTLYAIQAGTENDLIVSNIDGLLRDPWGSPYCLDENERDWSFDDCRNDTLRSVGPDGIYDTSDDVMFSDGLLPLSITCP